MKLNDDLSHRVVIETASLPWVASPTAGVERRMLERDGDEVARATSLVRYAPGSRFPAHEHGGGEEIYVVEGVFGDEHGTYPAGTYLRNPIGSAHAPFSEPGCVLLVKLRQMHGPEPRLVVDANALPWEERRTPGLARRMLHFDKDTGEMVYLTRFEPGVRVDDDLHMGGEELLVLEGTLEDEFGTYPAGTWLRQPHGSRHAPFSTEGAVIWVKRGHLPQDEG